MTTVLELSELKVLDLAAWRGFFVVSMQRACSAQLTYSLSLLSESICVLVKETQSLSGVNVWPAASSGSAAVASQWEGGWFSSGESMGQL